MKWITPVLAALVAIVLLGCIAGVEVDVDTRVYVKVGGRVMEWLGK